MGVTGLWKILEQAGVGHPIKLEGLEGKRIAVDANVWLYKFIRGFRDKEQGINLDAHKIGLFLRICKLLYYRIKPLFVFDGPAPILKRKTLDKRKEIRHKMLEKVHEGTKKRLLAKLRELCPDTDLNMDAFKLPSLKSDVLLYAETFTERDSYRERKSSDEEKDEDDEEEDEEEGEEEDDDDDKNDKVRIVESKPSRRYYIEDYPEEAESFSKFQLERLLNKRGKEVAPKQEQQPCKPQVQAVHCQPRLVLEISSSSSSSDHDDDFEEVEVIEQKSCQSKQIEKDESSQQASLTRTEPTPSSREILEISSSDDEDDDDFEEVQVIEQTSPESKQQTDIEHLTQSAQTEPRLERPKEVASSSSHLPRFSQYSSETQSESHTNRRVTDKIVEDCKSLLLLFGIPYIVAPGEAEAQCAALEKLGLTQGTITDDSDIWLFGAQNVYRNFSTNDKFVMQYKMNDIEFHARLSRENLICFAMLVGSDYTDGIDGIGAVHAIEILSEFQGDGLKPLTDFKKWFDEHKKDKRNRPGSKKREKFLHFDFPEQFPSYIVFEGYMQPLADMSTEQFSWAMPKAEELKEYAIREIGWTSKQVDDKLQPVMKRLEERRVQPNIESYFLKVIPDPNAQRFNSKRVNEALSKLTKSPEKSPKKKKKE